MLSIDAVEDVDASKTAQMMKRKDLENDSVIVRPEAKSMKTDSSEKEKKYDRQLRLWGDHGQSSLENARVCLVNATATGTELLKSLVLPGIGCFTVIDNSTVTEEDLGSNFFLTASCIGKPRAEAVCNQLKDLNGSSQGRFVLSSPSHFFENERHELREFDVVITSRLGVDLLCNVSKYLWEYRVPHVVCESYGFLGHLRVDIPEHAVIEAHPDNALPDLRLHNPFPSLVEFMNCFDLESMNHHDHGHVPYLVIIYKALTTWRSTSGKNWPTTYKEKSAIKDIIRNWVWENDNGVPENEENFEEAMKNINSVLVDPKLPSDVATILESSKEISGRTNNATFWILAQAVNQFIETDGNGHLPLRGSIPDMFCDSATFIQLQKCYKSKADIDAMAVKKYVDLLVVKLGYPSDYISLNEVKLFCRNVPNIQVLVGKPFCHELETVNGCQSSIDVADLDESTASIYVLVKAIYAFVKHHGRLPGTDSSANNEDLMHFCKCVDDLEKTLGLTETRGCDYAVEVCRWRCAEVHSVFAVLAGIAAQEVIKVVTKQYIPIDNTLLYNAISQETVVMKL